MRIVSGPTRGSAPRNDSDAGAHAGTGRGGRRADERGRAGRADCLRATPPSSPSVLSIRRFYLAAVSPAPPGPPRFAAPCVTRAPTSCPQRAVISLEAFSPPATVQEPPPEGLGARARAPRSAQAEADTVLTAAWRPLKPLRGPMECHAPAPLPPRVRALFPREHLLTQAGHRPPPRPGALPQPRGVRLRGARATRCSCNRSRTRAQQRDCCRHTPNRTRGSYDFHLLSPIRSNAHRPTWGSRLGRERESCLGFLCNVCQDTNPDMRASELPS